MKRVVSIVLVLFIALLPLRGFAAFAGDPCATDRLATAPAAMHHDCDHAKSGPDPSWHHASGQTGEKTDSCADCAACFAGFGAPASLPALALGGPSGCACIAFRPHHAGGHFPSPLDRPPLAL